MDMEMQSEKVEKLVEALISARKDMDGAVKNGKGNWGAYASLEDLLECCMNPLLYNGIMLTQPTIYKEGVNQVVTQLTHLSGQWMKSSITITVVKDNDPQKALAGQTYARRGGIETILSIPRIDDDGASQTRKVPAKKEAVVPPKVAAVLSNAKKVYKKKGIDVSKSNMDAFVSAAEDTLDDIPFGGIDEEPACVTTAERNEFVAYVQNQGITVEEVKAILTENGVATSADIPRERLGFFKSRVQNFASEKGRLNGKQ
jgi:hypothetical protein